MRQRRGRNLHRHPYPHPPHSRWLQLQLLLQLRVKLKPALVIIAAIVALAGGINAVEVDSSTAFAFSSSRTSSPLIHSIQHHRDRLPPRSGSSPLRAAAAVSATTAPATTATAAGTAASTTKESAETRAKCGSSGALAEAASVTSEDRGHLTEHTRTIVETGYRFTNGRPRGS